MYILESNPLLKLMLPSHKTHAGVLMYCIHQLQVIGRAQRARTSELNGNFVCMYVCMYVYMSSTDRGQCACVPAQRANVAGLASSARCARPQMLCILLVHVLNGDRCIDGTCTCTYTTLCMYLGRADLEGNLEFLQELDVLPFQGLGKGVVPKEMRHLNYTCK